MNPASVYLAVGAVDLRGAFDRLAAITRQVLQMDPASGALFLFFNRRRNRLKALWWDRNGYIILYKRLSKGTFAIPQQPCEGGSIEISPDAFARLLSGLALDKVSAPPPTIH